MREIQQAEILSIGSELTVGETRDTNAGELARSLTDAGVEVLRMTALPDDQPVVRDAVIAGLARVDLVVTTGGLGPTPDDLTRESIAEAIDETPTADPELVTWLRGLFERRGIAFPATNLKQAWVTPSTTVIPNANGSAPGWWVDRPDGRIVVALPGPPREMRPMWTDWVVPRLRERGLGQALAAVTLRTTGLGESLIAELLGGLLDRGANPTVATYARADGVDIRISAVPTHVPARDLVASTEQEVRDLIGDHVWGHGGDTWPSVIEAGLRARNWRLAIIEIGTRGSVAAVLAEGLGDRVVRATALPEPASVRPAARLDLRRMARECRDETGADIGLAVRTRARGDDLAVTIAIADRGGTHLERRVVFLAGTTGRTRAALLAAAVLHQRIR